MMEGWLLKRGKQDHRRYCSLKGWNLSWKTSNDTSGEVLGVLDLRGSKCVPHAKVPLTFTIEGGIPLNSSKMGKDYTLTADSEETFKQWKEACEKACELKDKDKVQQKGYLLKEGGKGFLSGKGQDKRWFELKGHIVTYSEHEGGKLSGQLDLRGARVKCSSESLSFTLDGPILNVQKKGKSYELAALTFEEMRDWTEKLKKACESQEI
eukprot:TRINITY_DN9744_c0_g1_i1.p1 TRINITY_DN9744_c0_g1~~TRINITY_DN9744_c0_g1_i1.p1  ORF type:complete len:209 (+),score=89.38 TRINITY_DN9744_c0_g1_i1:109-735(+)